MLIWSVGGSSQTVGFLIQCLNPWHHNAKNVRSTVAEMCWFFQNCLAAGSSAEGEGKWSGVNDCTTNMTENWKIIASLLLVHYLFFVSDFMLRLRSFDVVLCYVLFCLIFCSRGPSFNFSERLRLSEGGEPLYIPLSSLLISDGSWGTQRLCITRQTSIIKVSLINISNLLKCKTLKASPVMKALFSTRAVTATKVFGTSTDWLIDWLVIALNLFLEESSRCHDPHDRRTVLSPVMMTVGPLHQRGVAAKS